jgi:ribosomal protein L6P/L9E
MKIVQLPENKSSVNLNGGNRKVSALSVVKSAISQPVLQRKDSTQVYSKRVYLAGVGYSAYVASSNCDVLGTTHILKLKLGYSDVKSLVIPTGIATGANSGVLVVDRSVLNPNLASAKGSVGAAKVDAKGSSDSSASRSPIKAVIIIRGTDKECVNSFAASIRQLRPLSRYKGIGVSLEQEYEERKVISSAKKKK